MHVFPAIARADGGCVRPSIVLASVLALEEPERYWAIARVLPLVEYAPNALMLRALRHLTSRCGSLRIALLVLESAAGQLLLLPLDLLLVAAGVPRALLLYSFVIEEHALVRVVVGGLKRRGGSARARLSLRGALLEVDVLLGLRDHQSLLLAFLAGSKDAVELVLGMKEL